MSLDKKEKHKTSQYLSFDCIIEPNQNCWGQKTEVWVVWNSKFHTTLGRIKWHGPWRKYCFEVSGEFIFDADCLSTIAEFCERKTKERKSKK